MTGETGDREACEKKKKSATFETGGRAADGKLGKKYNAYEKFKINRVRNLKTG